MRIKFGPFGLVRADTEHERDYKRWRCCLCCHVRTATIFLGVWHLALHVLSLAAISVIVLHPQVVLQKQNAATGGSFVLPELDPFAIQSTPVTSEVREEPYALPYSEADKMSGGKQSIDSNAAKLFCGSLIYKDWFSEHQLSEHHVTYQDLNISIGVTFCTLAITLLMIYGTIRGKSLYLMPFFCLKAFDFFVTSLSVIGYLSYVPDIRQMLMKNSNFPLREKLLAMDPQCLSLLILAGILLSLIVKAYCINIVWNCYKFLAIKAEAVSECENRMNGVVDSQNLLDVTSVVMVPSGDLPDYATAVADPRFVKKTMYPVAPPPYAAVVDLPPEEPANNTTTDTNAQENPKPL